MNEREESLFANTVDLLEQPWTRFRQCLPDPRDPESEIFINSRYQVHRRRLSPQKEGPDLIHLSLKRRDQGILIPFLDKLRIKNELTDSLYEGVELLPARSREVDTANQFHLWVVASRRFHFLSDMHIPGTVLTSPLRVSAASVLLTSSWTPLHPHTQDGEDIIYHNNRYQIRLQRMTAVEVPDTIRLVCQHLDGSSLIPYRDRMRIKDEVIGAECEGIELLPSNSWADAPSAGCVLWIIDNPTFRFPFGFPDRYVSDAALDGAVQEPWPPEERPADCLSEAELRAFLEGHRKGG